MKDKEILQSILTRDTKKLSDLMNQRVNMDQPLDKGLFKPLHYAVIKRDFEIVKQLLEYGVDVNSVDNRGKSSLHYACHDFSPQIVELLLDYGAEINCQDNNGNTPLFDAVYNAKGKEDIIKLLLFNGANPDIMNRNEVSPRILAKMIANFNYKHLF